MSLFANVRKLQFGNNLVSTQVDHNTWRVDAPAAVQIPFARDCTTTQTAGNFGIDISGLPGTIIHRIFHVIVEGTSTFTLNATDSNGNFMDGNYATVLVVGMNTTSPGYCTCGTPVFGVPPTLGLILCQPGDFATFVSVTGGGFALAARKVKQPKAYSESYAGGSYIWDLGVDVGPRPANRRVRIHSGVTIQRGGGTRAALILQANDGHYDCIDMENLADFGNPNVTLQVEGDFPNNDLPTPILVNYSGPLIKQWYTKKLLDY